MASEVHKGNSGDLGEAADHTEGQRVTPPARFVIGDLVTALGFHGSARIEAALYRPRLVTQEPHWEYCVLFSRGRLLKLPESLLTLHHPVTCESPQCQIPF